MDGDDYFTIAYILLTVAVVLQVVYYSFMVYSYQNIKRTLMEKGRLLQITPLISIAAVCVQPNHLVSYPQPGYSAAPQAQVFPYPVTTSTKVPPPPYAP